jgi:NAD(P)-dependent dehydrogenase (short-subunit alcohol dehydrogenase family)
MAEFAGKAAIVTGGGMGIGGAIARRLAAEGASVLVADYDADAGEANARRIREAGGRAEAIATDVSRGDQIAAMVEEADRRFGGVHILVNNAWGSRERDGTAETLTETAWHYAMDTMVKAHFLAAKYSAPLMRKAGGGSIVNIASVHGQLMARNHLAYETAKSAVIGMTKAMACDFGPDGIRVNAICPGHIVTEKLARHWERNPTLHALFVAQYPVRRTGTPDDVAHAVRFLCSDDAAFITGHALVVDGGLTIQLQESLGMAQAKYVRDHPEVELG